MSGKWWLACLVALPLSGVARDYDERSCQGIGPFFYEKGLTAATVSAGGRSYLHDDIHRCPEPTLNCRTATFVAQGDRVIVAQQDGPYACVWVDHGYGLTGWVERARLDIKPAVSVSALDFVGLWASSDGPDSGYIKINQEADGRLAISGKAYWPGKGIFPEHEGAIASEDEDEGPVLGTLHENVLRWGNPDAEFECSGQMTLINGRLIFNDNDKCGGANVTFTDAYRRLPRKHR